MPLLLADFHLHIYRTHQRELLIRALFANLTRLTNQIPASSPPPILAAFLADRRRSSLFRDWRRGLIRVLGCSARPADDLTLRLETPNGQILFLFAGRQITTREGLELLTLVSDNDIPDALLFPKAVEMALRDPGIPVIPWAPGKWLGTRASLVRQGLETLRSRHVLIADPAIRPAGLPDPPLFRQARRLDIPIVAGSDIYPFPGEEPLAGTYATLIEGTFDAEHPADSIRSLLQQRPLPHVRRIGRRSSFPAAIRRWLTHRLGFSSPEAAFSP